MMIFGAVVVKVYPGKQKIYKRKYEKRSLQNDKNRVR